MASLKGYAYQLYASALAWLDLRDGEDLYLEVAEDYAVVTTDALSASQVKDSASASLTLRSEAALQALDAYVDLCERNPGRDIRLRFLTTAPIGTEQRKAHRVNGASALEYWRQASAGADVAPLRAVLGRLELTDRVKKFIAARDDTALRAEFLRNIHWDCGQPDFRALKQELDDRLVRLGTTQLSLPASECSRLSSALIERVLSVATTPDAPRRLTAPMLAVLLDGASRVGVQIGALESQLRLLTAAFGGSSGPGALSTTLVLDSEADLPWPSLVAPRTDFVGRIASEVTAHGLVFLAGATGMGKTLLARLVARSIGGDWLTLDLRDASAAETTERLRAAASEVGGRRPRGVIIDDANELNDATVQVALARFVTTLRRFDALCLAISYLEPSARIRDQIGITTAASLAVPDLTKDEVGDIVVRAGGDKKWEGVVYAVGGFGHPQLTQAAIAGFKARGWQAADLKSAVGDSFVTNDVVVERANARTRLLGDLPDPARLLLYRLSLLLGRFSRSMASAIGAVAPPIALPGAQLDSLVGPWIDRIAHDQLRVSPLVSDAGNNVLAEAEKKAVHNAAAHELVRDKKVNVSHVNAAFMHAVLGEADVPLTKLASAVITTEDQKLSELSEWFMGLRFQRTDRPIYPQKATLSRMLRLGQLLLLVAKRDDEKARSCLETLRREVAEEKDDQLRKGFEAVAIGKLLCRSSIAEIFPGWLALVIRLDELVNEQGFVKQAALNFASFAEGSGHNFTVTGFMFALHALGVPSVANLEALFNELHGLKPELRDRLLSDLNKNPGDFNLLVNNAWAAQHLKGTLNGHEAAQAYARMAILARAWSFPSLAMRCEIARSVMLDEYANDSVAATTILAQAASEFGQISAISRAQGKILYRAGNYAAALPVLWALADQEAGESRVERAFLMREAGICAAHLGDPKNASEWYLRAEAAIGSTDLVGMKAMKVGLLADAAVAAWLAGDKDGAIRLGRRTLEALPSLDVADPKHAACYKLVGHAIWWIQTRATASSYGKEAQITPGACSNLDPHPEVAKMQRAPIDVAWYLLAEAEVASGVKLGIVKELPSKLTQGSIPLMEIQLRSRVLGGAVRELDEEGFATALVPWTDALAYNKLLRRVEF